jgi:DNA-binding transcriptional MerR regulator
MRISELADRVGATPQAVRFYEARDTLPAPPRASRNYRDYGAADEERLRLLLGLRRLDLPLDKAGELAGLCASGHCDQVSDELRALVSDQRRQIRSRRAELQRLDAQLVRLERQLASGAAPRPLITLGKEEDDGHL